MRLAFPLCWFEANAQIPLVAFAEKLISFRMARLPCGSTGLTFSRQTRIHSFVVLIDSRSSY